MSRWTSPGVCVWMVSWLLLFSLFFFFFFLFLVFAGPLLSLSLSLSLFCSPSLPLPLLHQCLKASVLLNASECDLRSKRGCLLQFCGYLSVFLDWYDPLWSGSPLERNCVWMKGLDLVVSLPNRYPVNAMDRNCHWHLSRCLQWPNLT